MSVPLGRITIYTKDVAKLAAFYCRHFGFKQVNLPGDRITELKGEGASILLHEAGARQKMGQVLVKLNFDVPDVPAFAAKAAEGGLNFSRPFKGDGYLFANAKDPSGNPICITSRAFASPS